MLMSSQAGAGCWWCDGGPCLHGDRWKRGPTAVRWPSLEKIGGFNVTSFCSEYMFRFARALFSTAVLGGLSVRQ